LLFEFSLFAFDCRQNVHVASGKEFISIGEAAPDVEPAVSNSEVVPNMSIVLAAGCENLPAALVELIEPRNQNPHS
jgi:hypothetical protein